MRVCIKKNDKKYNKSFNLKRCLQIAVLLLFPLFNSVYGVEMVAQEAPENPTSAAFHTLASETNSSKKLFEATQAVYDVYGTYLENTSNIEQQLFLKSALQYNNLKNDPLLNVKLKNIDQNIRDLALKLRPMMQRYRTLLGKNSVELRVLQLPVVDSVAFQEHTERFSGKDDPVIKALWKRYWNTRKLLALKEPVSKKFYKRNRESVLQHLDALEQTHRQLASRMDLEWTKIELMERIGEFAFDVLLFRDLHSEEKAEMSERDEMTKSYFLPREYLLKDESYLFSIPGKEITPKKWEKGKRFVSCVRQGRWLKVSGEKERGIFKKMKPPFWMHEEIVSLQRRWQGPTSLNACGAKLYTLSRNAAIRDAPEGRRVNVFSPEIKILAIKEGESWLRILRYENSTEDWRKYPKIPYWTHVSNIESLRGD